MLEQEDEERYYKSRMVKEIVLGAYEKNMMEV